MEKNRHSEHFITRRTYREKTYQIKDKYVTIKWLRLIGLEKSINKQWKLSNIDWFLLART